MLAESRMFFFFFFKSDMETRDEQEAYLFFQINEM